MNTTLLINYIELQSTDFNATKAFYEAAFGWRFTDWGPDYISFDNAGIDGGFALVDTPSPHGALVVLLTEDIDAAETAVTNAGGSIVARHEFPGGKRFEFNDPTGNRLAVWMKQAVTPPA